MSDTSKRYIKEIDCSLVIDNNNRPISIVNNAGDIIRIKKASKIYQPFTCWVGESSLYAYDYPTLLTISSDGEEKRQMVYSVEEAGEIARENKANPYVTDDDIKIIQDCSGNIFKMKVLNGEAMLVISPNQEIEVHSIRIEVNSTYVIDSNKQKLYYNKEKRMFEPEKLRYEAFYTKVPNTELVGKSGDIYVSLDPSTYEILKVIPTDFMEAMLKIGRAMEVKMV